MAAGWIKLLQSWLLQTKFPSMIKETVEGESWQTEIYFWDAAPNKKPENGCLFKDETFNRLFEI